MIITQDLHIHTNLSVCAPRTTTLKSYIESAENLGLKTIGISNHMWSEEQEIPYIDSREGYDVFSGSYKKQDFSNITEIVKDKYFNCSNVKILCGAEVEYNPKLRQPAINVRQACKLDYLLVPNSHTHLIMDKSLYEPKTLHVRFMLDAFEHIVESAISQYILAIAHPFAAVNCPYDNRELIKLITNQQFYDCFVEAKKHDIAIEINSRIFSDRSNIEADEMLRMFFVAKDAGCKFTIGSDAHDPKTQNDLIKAEKVIKLINAESSVVLL